MHASQNMTGQSGAGGQERGGGDRDVRILSEPSSPSSVELVRLALLSSPTTLLAFSVIVPVVLLASGTVSTSPLEFGRLLILVCARLVARTLVKWPALVEDAADWKEATNRASG